MAETILQTKTCPSCGISFDITDKDMEFYDKMSPIFDGKKYEISTPTLCPDCRQQRRSSFSNIRNLYKRKCAATGKDIISMYSPDKAYTVYSQDIWWGDSWDAMDYGKDFDYQRSFFSQIESLIKIVPKIALSTEKLENSPYVNYC